MKKQLIFFVLLTVSYFGFSQGLLSDKEKFNRQDTLRGSITPEREWWDLKYYHLDIDVNPNYKFISGKNTIQYEVLKPYQTMQIDLQSPMEITKVIQNGKELDVKHEGNAHFIQLNEKQNIDDINSVIVHYKGFPREAKRAPWDGGFSWKKDNNGKHFIATSNQGLGASVWWPNKDHMYDEVDSMLISVTNPKGLTNVSNGRLRKLEDKDDKVTSHWFVDNPINNYGVNVNIGDYVNFSEVYIGEKGNLDMDYWVLRDNLEKAKEHFKDAPKMMKAFEHWFGPYPFYEDSFKLVEVPYLGMEHQSSVTYGNQYKKGYLGRDLSSSGWGLKFDFIIIHEAGHEWFANNITNKDVADMWIHEGFTAYSENLFLDYYYGKEASADYVIGTRANIRNDKPLIGPYNVNKEGSSDIYYKGANLLHTIRQIIEDDDLWRKILRGLNEEFYHQTVTTKQVEDYINNYSWTSLTSIFDQYLRSKKIPRLDYKFENDEFFYKWSNVIDGFDMPVKITLDNETSLFFPETKWKSTPIKKEAIVVDRNFYIETQKL